VPEGGRDLSYRGFGVRILVSGEESGGAMTVLEHSLASGLIPMPRHVQTRETTSLIVLDGQLAVEVDGHVTTIRAGESIVLRPGTARAYWNHSGAGVRFLQIITPGGIDRYYEELRGLIPAGGTPDVDSVLALSARHGLEFDTSSLFDLIEKYPIRLV
jgi:quercetin dioxygenase-like cupin family protein